jgi:hypothetical protein
VGRWGSLQGGLGVCLIVGSTAIGAIVTMATRSAPGFMLGVFLVIGTVAAGLAVRPTAGRLILPVPVLSYLVAALITGVIYNRSGDSSKAALAIGAAQWMANGFLAMASATVLAIGLIAVRWYLWRRNRRDVRNPGWPVPAAGAAGRPPAGRETFADPSYPASYGDPGTASDGGGTGGAGAWTDRGPPGPGTPGPGHRRPGPYPGSGPYNFSSGA